MGDNSKSYDEFTINFKLEEDVPIDQYDRRSKSSAV